MTHEFKFDAQAYAASCTACGDALADEKKGLSGRQYRRETSFMTWKIECSIGGARELGSGLR